MTVKVLLALMLAAGGYLSVNGPNLSVKAATKSHGTAADLCCTDPPPPDCPPACGK